MPKVKFKFDIEKDAKNYYDAVNSTIEFGIDFSKSVKPELLPKLRGKKWKDAKKYIINYLNRRYTKNKENYQKKLDKIKKSWGKIEEKYFKKLEEITKRKIYRENFTCYATTIGRCPYNIKENWFMTNIFCNINHSLLTIVHELMHLQIHYYFEKKLREKISYKKFQDLKEALTILLNIEFRDILNEEDVGYPNHVDLRNFIKEQWKKEKDFDVLLDKCVEHLS